MVFDSGAHALSWLVNESDSLTRPGTTTDSICGMLQGLIPMMNADSFSYDTDDKHHAKFDLEKMFRLHSQHEQEVLLVMTIEGMQAAVAFLKSNDRWKDWRAKNRAALERGEVTYSGQLWSVLDKWEATLIENDYMGVIF